MKKEDNYHLNGLGFHSFDFEIKKNIQFFIRHITIQGQIMWGVFFNEKRINKNQRYSF